jgi:hypothetical protein
MLRVRTAALATVLVLTGGTLASQQRPLTRWEQQARDLLKELVEHNTTQSAGDMTAAAEAMARHMRAAGFPAEDVVVVESGAPKKGNLLLADLGQRFLAHQPGAQAGELAFRHLRKARVQLVGHGAAQHAVAEELQALVVVRAVAAMRERLLGQRRCAEAVPEPGFEGRVPRRGYSCAEFAAKSMYRPTLANSGISLR